MNDYGFWSVVPPLLAIGLAIATRRVVVSLLAAVFVGALILAHGNPATALFDTVATYSWGSLADTAHLQVFAFTLLMGAMVGVMHRSGGMHGLVTAIAPAATNRRRGQLACWFGGLVVFFDDYANTLLLGSTMRPLTDRLKISREKLAYIVDSTAAPVAGIAILSTWVASEVGYIDSGLQQAGVSADSYRAFEVFLVTIPYRFYPLFALFFVGVVACSRRDFGSMLAAERRAVADGVENVRNDHPAAGPDETQLLGWYNAVVPVLVVIAMVSTLIYTTGKNDSPKEATLWQVIGNGNSYLAMMYGSLGGLVVAAALAGAQKILSPKEIGKSIFSGARLMLPALAVLWLAWALADVTGKSTADAVRLDTAGYLGSLMTNVITPEWMPTIVFLLASAVAFATGTSWGTMGILTPLAIDVTWRLLGDSSGGAIVGDPIMSATIGSVLAGAIFGDHCSPISDTTVLSSVACGCDHIAHVWTQLPYALAVGGVAIVCGTIPVGFGAPVWVLLPVGAFALVVLVFVIGRRAEFE